MSSRNVTDEGGVGRSKVGRLPSSGNLVEIVHVQVRRWKRKWLKGETYKGMERGIQVGMSAARQR